MSFIVECRINGRERIYRVSDKSGNDIKILWSAKTRERPKTLTVCGEEIQSDTIQLVSPEELWREHDDRAQREKNRQRCTHCFTIHTMGESCTCTESAMAKVGLLAHEDQSVPVIPPDRIANGMIRAINIALTYKGVSHRSPFIVGYMRRHGITWADLDREAAKMKTV